MKNKPFVITRDKATARQLMEIGLELLSELNGEYTFLNCSDKYQRTDFSRTDAVETDKLNL